MAKIESVSRSSFYDKASFPELKFGLDLVEDCSPKYDFDISSLLTDINTNLDKQSTDNNLGEKIDGKKNKCSSLTSSKIETPKFSSLCALAENHLKENKMLPELSLEGDFSLSDLLSNEDYPSAKSSKNVISSESDNLFDFLLIEDDSPLTGSIPSAENNVSYDDLSVWMKSSNTQNVNSLEFLCNSDLLNKVKFENASSGLSEEKSKDNTNYLQEKSNTTNISNVDLATMHKEESVDSFELTDNLDSIDKNRSKTNESVNEISDSEFLPDIDLTFCIKKNSKKDYLFYGNSPETTDSGFDESDFMAEKLSIPSKTDFVYRDMFMSQSGSNCKSISSDKIKQSLFSKAISAKPKIDDSRKLKLKSVMNELLKGSTFLLHPAQERNSPKITDCSNENVIVSCYLEMKNRDETVMTQKVK